LDAGRGQKLCHAFLSRNELVPCLELLRVVPYHEVQGVGPSGRLPTERLQWLLEPTTKSAS